VGFDIVLEVVGKPRLVHYQCAICLREKPFGLEAEPTYLAQAQPGYGGFPKGEVPFVVVEV
jgi:hypothetical protein